MNVSVILLVVSVIVGVTSAGASSSTTGCRADFISLRTLDEDTSAPARVPWNAAIYARNDIKKELICSGVLVSPTHVITAAHCFWTDYSKRREVNMEIYEVVLGKRCKDLSIREPDVQYKSVRNITTHPWYRGTLRSPHGDVAVVELQTAVDITEFVNMADINRNNTSGGRYVPEGTTGTVTGWSDAGGQQNYDLHSDSLTYINTSTCHDMLTEEQQLDMTRDMFCAEVNRAVCKSDAGAGFVYTHPTNGKNILLGVLNADFRPSSFTGLCYNSTVAGFTNIAEVTTLAQIKEIVPSPPVPCPAVRATYCHKLDMQVDCSMAMTAGTVAVTVCSPGCTTSTNNTVKRSTCFNNGTWESEVEVCRQDDPCLPSPCGPNSQCLEVRGHAMCSCLPTYLGSPPSCRTDPCLPSPCGPYSQCLEVRGHAMCSCLPTYLGSPPSCRPDPCLPSPCGPNSQCLEVRGQAECSCIPTYLGSPPNCRPECVRNSECTQNRACVDRKCVDPCVGTCGVNARCTVEDHIASCSCESGYIGDPTTHCTKCGLASDVTYVKLHGEDVLDGRLPWNIRVYHHSSYFCVGTLITPSHVVTLANCVSGRSAANLQLAARKLISTFSLSEPNAQLRGVKQVILHEQFSGEYGGVNDIAVLVADRDFSLSTKVSVACVDWSRLMSATSSNTFIGDAWVRGKIDTTRYLTAAQSHTLVDDVTCRAQSESSRLKYLTSDKFCARQSSRETCDDSRGGGLMMTSTGGDQHYLLGGEKCLACRDIKWWLLH